MSFLLGVSEGRSPKGCEALLAAALVPLTRKLAIETEAAAAHIEGRALSHKPNWDGLSPELELEKPHAWSRDWEQMTPAMYSAVSSCRFQSMRQRLPDRQRVAKKFGVSVEALADTLRSAPQARAARGRVCSSGLLRRARRCLSPSGDLSATSMRGRRPRRSP